MVYAVILAGGVGSRMGGDKPKQYLTVKDKPIIVYTIEKFFAVPDFKKIIVLCPKQWVEHTKNLIEKHIAPASDKIAVIEGGDTRNETIMNAIKFIEAEGNLNDDTIMLLTTVFVLLLRAELLKKTLNLQSSTALAILSFPLQIRLLRLMTTLLLVQSLTEAKCIRVKLRNLSMHLNLRIFTIRFQTRKKIFLQMPLRYLLLKAKTLRLLRVKPLI